MTSKMKSRLCVTKETLSADSRLPKDLGGNGESYKELATYWKKRAQENSQWYRDMEGCSKYLDLKN